ncbi:MAG: tRNA adenosine(34) deaminase TadA [Lactobacillus sp.]|nr:tRNA adenosine(34) deaminase TadA [Lactobacillus sp.]
MEFTNEDKKKYMELAFQEAMEAESQGEIPIGAVIVDENGCVIGKGYNRRELDNDATKHAEIIAIREANKALNSWRLEKCTLFVTLEPCAMCAGAIINSRIKTVFFGALDPKAGAGGSVVDLFSVEKFNHHPQVIRGVFRDRASQMLKDFFRAIREKKKLVKKE